MTSSLAASFRALFPAIVAVAALAVLGGSGLLLYLGYGLPAALGLLLIGAIALIALFGMVAVQIDNNELLAVIAEALVDARDGRMPAEPPATASRVAAAIVPGSAPRAVDPLVLRPEGAPAPKAAAPRPQPAARVEPVLSARRG